MAPRVRYGLPAVRPLPEVRSDYVCDCRPVRPAWRCQFFAILGQSADPIEHDVAEFARSLLGAKSPCTRQCSQFR